MFEDHNSVSRRKGNTYGLGSTVRFWKDTWLQEDRLFIQCDYEHRQRAKSLPHARWEGSSKAWHSPFTGATWDAFVKAFPRLDPSSGEGFLYEDEDNLYQSLQDAANSWRAAAEAKSAVDLPDIPTRTVAAGHQRRCFHFGRQLKSAGLFVEMGGGKSAVAIGLCEEWDTKLVVILCPKSVIGVWPKQFAIHAQRDWMTWTGDAKGIVKAKAMDLMMFVERARRASRPAVVIMNYDIAWRDGMLPFLCSTQFDVLICDESHRIKSAGGKASRAAARIARQSERVLLLTGTPTPHGPEDVYGQYRAADPNIFGTNYDRFKKTYFLTRPINDKVDRVVGFLSDESERKYKEKLASISIVVKKEDMDPIGDFDPGRVWSLPAIERQVRLENKTWRAYQELKNELVAEVDAGLVTADNILVKGLRLRQVTGGFVPVEDVATGTSTVQQIGSEKQSLLAEVLEDIPGDEPVVVFGVFHTDLDQIRDVAHAMGRVYLELSGRRRDALAPDSTLATIGSEIVGVQLQSGGVGVDFTRAAYGIDFAVDYNLGNVLQSRARLDRPGQTRAVTWIHLVSVGPTGQRTVDGVTYDALMNRKQINEAVLDALRKKEL
jgi:SNF2 family DNA or RNA helicase